MQKTKKRTCLKIVEKVTWIAAWPRHIQRWPKKFPDTCVTFVRLKVHSMGNPVCFYGRTRDFTMAIFWFTWTFFWAYGFCYNLHRTWKRSNILKYSRLENSLITSDFRRKCKKVPTSKKSYKNLSTRRIIVCLLNCKI